MSATAAAAPEQAGPALSDQPDYQLDKLDGRDLENERRRLAAALGRPFAEPVKVLLRRRLAAVLGEQECRKGEPAAESAAGMDSG
jgi:hypothetical protein